MSIRKIGIEIENESLAISLRQAQRILGDSDNWVVESDGSLRGNGNGWEIKTAGQGRPLSRALNSLNELYPVMRDSSGVWRAAVHVHVNAADLTWAQRAAVLCLGYIYDRSVFERVSPERVESNFCVPLNQRPNDVFGAVTSMLTQDIHGFYGKYSSINSDSLLRFGTFEFRHMRTPACDNTVDSIKASLDAIAEFANISHSIVNAGLYAPADCDISDGYSKFVSGVLRIVNAGASLFGPSLPANELAVLDMLSYLGDAHCSDMTELDLGSVLQCIPQQYRPRRLSSSLGELLGLTTGRAATRGGIGGEEVWVLRTTDDPGEFGDYEDEDYDGGDE